MIILNTLPQLRAALGEARQRGQRIGFVPTMGALHAGHVSLLETARARCDFVVASIFVNPTQFGPNEDLARYPRDLDGDADKCREAGADVLFAPEVVEMYPGGASTWVAVQGLTDGLCGAFRPGHFRGVTTVVARLFLMVQPDLAFFGEKDYQQLAVIRRMVRDLAFPVEIVGCPTLREPDGLAMSSRNVMLSAAARAQAPTLYMALNAAAAAFARGERKRESLLALVRTQLATAPLLRVQYIELVDPDALTPLGETLPDQAQLAIAAYAEGVRLIDNIRLS